jgi:hypothetical protein
LIRTASLDRADKAGAVACRPREEMRASGASEAKRLILLCALLLALLWQGVITQAHQHRSVGIDVAQIQSTIANDRRDNSAPDSPRNCPICEAASAGPALLPTPVIVAAPAALPFFAAALRPRQFLRSSRSHLWQSRAPPHQHQA